MSFSTLNPLSCTRMRWLHACTALSLCSGALVGCGDDSSPVTTSGSETLGESGTTEGPPSTEASDSEGSTGSASGSSDTGSTESGSSESDSGSTSSGTETGSSSGSDSDSSSGSSSDSTTGEPAVCGNELVEAGETCDDGGVVDGDGCDAVCAIEAGWLCELDSPCTPICGDDLVVGPEQCEGAELGGAACADEGFDGGTLVCDALTCTFDVASCFFVDTLQNDNGTCGNAVGCSNVEGTAGNPQTAFECYESGLLPPIDVLEVQYQVDNVTIPLPSALDLVVHAWDGPGNAPGALLGAYTLDPVLDIVAGSHTFQLPLPIQVQTPNFCVGFQGQDPADGFRLQFANGDNLGETYILAPSCGAATPIEMTSAGLPGNFCVRPTVQGH